MKRTKETHGITKIPTSTKDKKQETITKNNVWDGDIIPHIQNDSQTDKVFETLWYVKRSLCSTIRAVGSRLKHLAKNCNLNGPEIVNSQLYA